MGALVVRDSWLSRLLVRVGLIRPGEFSAGTDFRASVATSPGYSPIQAMSAIAAFPWVRACVKAKSVDLSGLPLRVTRGRGADTEILEDHDVLTLLEQPSERVNGLQFRRQLWVDLDLTGNWFGAMIGPGARPLSILRLHPQRVRIQPLADGQIGHYEYDRHAGTVPYDYSSILHIRGASWEDNPSGLFGTGLIRALHNDLSADLAASKASAKTASRGRPDSIVRPKDPTDRWTADQVDLIRQSIDHHLSRAEGGALILGASADYSPLSWSPKDMEFQALRVHVRGAVLAASGVPPSRVSLPTANYATAKEGDRTYWQALRGEAALIDAELTRLVRLWDPRLRISHDFSSVAALQEDRTAQVTRVREWWTMGLSLADAAAYEGFEDLPEPETLSRPSSTVTTPDESAPGPTSAAFGDWWRRAPSLQSVESPPDMQTEEGREIRWRGFLERIHTPIERGMNLVLRRFLVEQAQRYSDRLGEVLGQAADGQAADAPAPETRDIADADLARLLAESEEAQRLGDTIGPRLLDALRRAFQSARDDLALSGLDEDGLRLAEATLKADMIVFRSDVTNNVAQLTRDSVSFIVRDGLSTGATIQEMQTSIAASRAFSPARALTIARTETTRAVNRGTVESYRQAIKDLPDLRMEWLSARDDAVRDSHTDMDGVTSEVDGLFVNPGNAASAPHPGGFGIPGEDINCRCTVLPLLTGAS